MIDDKRIHWADYAASWNRLGPPLRPSATDIDYFESELRKRMPNSIAARAVIFGVTPEFASMHWPSSCDVLGFDYGFGMIQGVWPAHGKPHRHAICGDWHQLPLASASVDVCVGDGCFSMVDFPNGCARLADEANRVLKPGGIFLVRTFARGNQTKTVEEIIGLWFCRRARGGYGHSQNRFLGLDSDLARCTQFCRASIAALATRLSRITIASSAIAQRNRTHS